MRNREVSNLLVFTKDASMPVTPKQRMQCLRIPHQFRLLHLHPNPRALALILSMISPQRNTSQSILGPVHESRSLCIHNQEATVRQGEGWTALTR